MAVNPSAVREFLGRTLRNSDKAKSFTDRALDLKLAALQPPPAFVYPPYAHQKVCFLLGLKYDSYGFLLDMGLGKTKVVLDLFRYRRSLNAKHRMLVLVPGVGNIGQWEEEVHTHVPEASVAGLDETMSREDRLLAFTFNPDVVITTYQGWMALICKRAGGKMVVHEPAAKALEEQFDSVVFDESHYMKNPSSLTFKMCKRFIKTAKYRYILTGTPFSNDPQGLWSQFYVIDAGETLGPTIGLFREALFKKVKNWFSGWFDYELDKKQEPVLHAMIRNRSVRYTEEECLDLPPKVGGVEHPMVRPVTFSAETWAYYDRIVDELREAKGNFQLMDNAYMRLRMIVAGFLPTIDPEGGRHEIIFGTNPKLDALVELLEELGPERKVVVFHIYQTTGQLIYDRLKKSKIRSVRLFGKTPNKNEVIERFKTDPKVRVMVASKSGAHGLNLQKACHHMAFYETPDDITTRRQAEKRIRRPGQVNTTFYYDLVVKNSIDERILKSLQSGIRLFDALVDGQVTL